VVDATWDVTGIVEYAENDLGGVVITEATATHHHLDHVGGKIPKGMAPRGMDIAVEGMLDMKKSHGCNVSIGEEDAETASYQTSVDLKDIRLLKEGDKVPIGKNHSVYLRVLRTPGHTAGSCCFRIESSLESTMPSSVLFTGDTLFIGSCGRTDLPDSDAYDMFASLKKLSDLPKDDIVLPGHNYAAPTTSTIEIERKTNIMMVQAMQRVSSKAGGLSTNQTSSAVLLPDYLGIAEALLHETHDCCKDLESSTVSFKSKV
jgi:glyoxylase-like metal-dependent hydrolase (beta-lactamase superfamily II)